MIAFQVMIAVLMCFSPSYRIAVYAGVIWLIVLFVAYEVMSRVQNSRLDTARAASKQYAKHQRN